MNAEPTQANRRTRARLKQLLERSSFDLQLSQDAARSLEEFAIVQMVSRMRRELSDTLREIQADTLKRDKANGDGNDSR